MKTLLVMGAFLMASNTFGAFCLNKSLNKSISVKKLKNDKIEIKVFNGLMPSYDPTRNILSTFSGELIEDGYYLGDSKKYQLESDNYKAKITVFYPTPCHQTRAGCFNDKPINDCQMTRAGCFPPINKPTKSPQSIVLEGFFGATYFSCQK